MASLDIRNDKVDPVTIIYFADSNNGSAHYIEYYNSIVSVDDIDNCVKIASKEDAQNLIKALEKAIELGWWN